MKILYSEIALETLDVIIDFLELNWSEKQILFLKNDILKFEQTISDRLISHQSLAEFPAVRFTLIAKKQVKIYYMKIDDNIKILAFLPSKSNPATIKNILR
ncbi:hypothetical protein [Chryseobacterium turcicum]|uniref:Type II toxin-antitoxin system RelE/ParE family toxin n=1 Tax=Chryseobacterium turcicum TaxID=2898076 RepID=A0A9Q3V4T5_9FLAO|nr:hypothetical protein [Chryseobacterium turcicum]MCD1118387.1 hypothetical protein [Chryseobacterium turcicum]